MDKETIARINAPYRFEEFPKMLHHADGRTTTVDNAQAEATQLNNGFHPTPTLAQSERAKRDEAERQRHALAIGKEAKAKKAEAA